MQQPLTQHQSMYCAWLLTRRATVMLVALFTSSAAGCQRTGWRYFVTMDGIRTYY